MSKYEYVVSDGGPHIFLPKNLSSEWTGVSSSLDISNPNSDFGRAMNASLRSPLESITVGPGSVVVFEASGMTTWSQSSTGYLYIFDLVHWTSTDLDALVDRAAEFADESAMATTGIPLELAEADGYLIYAGDSPRSSAYGFATIPLAAGKYEVLTITYDGADGSVRVHCLHPVVAD
ncbi:MAG: hypothetical protein AAF078_06920 [Planctomycetota bacterium]